MEILYLPSLIICRRITEADFLPVISLSSLFLKLKRLEPEKEKLLTDHMSSNVLFPRELNSLEGNFYGLVQSCNSTINVMKTADLEDKRLQT